MNEALEVDFDVEVVEALSALERGEPQPLLDLLAALDAQSGQAAAPQQADVAPSADAAESSDDFDFFGAEVMIDFNEVGSSKSALRQGVLPPPSGDRPGTQPGGVRPSVAPPASEFQGHAPRPAAGARPEGARYLAEAPPPPRHRARATEIGSPRTTTEGPPVERDMSAEPVSNDAFDLDSWDFGGAAAPAATSRSEITPLEPAPPVAAAPVVAERVDTPSVNDAVDDAFSNMFEAEAIQPSIRNNVATVPAAVTPPETPTVATPPSHVAEHALPADRRPTPYVGVAPVVASPSAFSPTMPLEAVTAAPTRPMQATPSAPPPAVAPGATPRDAASDFGGGHSGGAARIMRSSRQIATVPPADSASVEPERGEITTPPNAHESVDEIMLRVRRLRDRGDVASALQGVELILAVDPSHPEAYPIREQLRHQLTVLRMAQLEPLDRVPALTPAAMSGASRKLNTRSAFLLSRVDGFSSLRDLIDMSGLPALEAIETVQQLIDEQLVRF
jgi:hypothetical protein